MNTIIIGILLAFPLPVNAQAKEIEIIEPIRSEIITSAIKEKESGGNYTVRGKSGEIGAYQFMPSTWKNTSLKYLGKEVEPTPENQDLIAKLSIEDLISQGYSDKEIALIWNGGTPTIKKGVNKYGVPYDTEKYANELLALIENRK